MTEPLLVHSRDAVATLTLNRPEIRNAFDDAQIERLTQALRAAEADPAVRVVVIAGNGPAFCAGADLNWMKRMAGYTYEQNLADATVLAEMLRTLDCMTKPTVARVHGAAFTTVAFVPRSSLTWIRGEDEASIYSTPLGNRRSFCGLCASPLFNVARAGDLAAVVIGSLQDADQPAPWAHVNTESKAPWHRISDDLPQFSTWPAADQLRVLADRHRCAWLPDQLLFPAT